LIKALIELEKALDGNPLMNVNTLAQAGVIPINLLVWRDVWQYFDARYQESKAKDKAVEITADRFDMSKRNIYRIIGKYE